MLGLSKADLLERDKGLPWWRTLSVFEAQKQLIGCDASTCVQELGYTIADGIEYVRAAMASGRFERVSTRFSANGPLLRLEPDRLQMAALGVDLSSVVSTLGTSFGSSYVNDSFEGDQVRRVIVQLDGAGRRDAADVLALQVRSRSGQLIPLGQLLRLEPDVFGITVFTDTFGFLERMGPWWRQHFGNRPLVIGGPLVSGAPETCMAARTELTMPR